MYEAHTTLLENIGRRQDGVSEDLSKYSDNLDALQENFDSLHLEGGRASIQSEEQKRILEAIQQKIESMKTDPEMPSTLDENKTSNVFTKALVVTTNRVSLVLSGAMFTSAHTLASQARDMSTIARRFESRPPFIEQPPEENEAIMTSSRIALSKAVDSGRPAL